MDRSVNYNVGAHGSTMNGEVPPVPLTTLAGITGISNLLPEMPLPSPLPQALSNKSLLFHHRVSEEAKLLLNCNNESLVPQLLESIEQTSADHIELNEPYTAEELQPENCPPLLKRLLQRNPNVFKGQVGGTEMQSSGEQNESLSGDSGFYCVSSLSHLLQSSSSNEPLSSTSSSDPSSSISSNDGSSSSSFGSSVIQRTGVVPRVSVITEQQGRRSRRSCVVQNDVKKENGKEKESSKELPEESKTPRRRPSIDKGKPMPDKVKPSTEKIKQAPDKAKPTPEKGKQTTEKGKQTTDKGKTTPDKVKSTPDKAKPTADKVKPAVEKPTPVKVKQAPDKAKPSTEKNSTKSTDKNSTKSEKSNMKNMSERKSTKAPDVKPSDSVIEKAPVKNEEKGTPASVKTKEKEESPKMTPSANGKNHKIDESRNFRTRRSAKQIIESSDEEKEEEAKNKFFPTKAKEKSLQKRKEREEKRKKKYSDDEDYMPEESQTSESKTSSGESVTKKRGRVSTSEEREEKKDDSDGNRDDVPKKAKIRKIERRLVPILEKLSPEELLETNTYQKFSRIMDSIFDATEDVDLKAELDDDVDIPQEALLAKYQLTELREEAAKLKMRNSMELVPPERLVRLMTILEKNIWDGARISPVADPDEDEDSKNMWLELVMDRVGRAAEASLTVLYILTSKHMSKRVYLDDIIERTVMFTKFQLSNTIYPCFDPVYRTGSKLKEVFYPGNMKRKRAHAKEVRRPEIVQLYNRLHEIVGLLADLLDIQVLTDTTVLQVSTLGVAPFFVENVNDLQLSALKLVTAIFSKYDKHRKLVLDDILASIARLPSSKRSLRTYHLEETGENIQMLTALVLQLIQCVAAFPKHLMYKEEAKTKDGEKTVVTKVVDKETFIITSYEVAVVTAANFLTMFLRKCGSKTEEIDFRPIFENFIQDLLSTVNKPQWPAAELLLSLLGKLLVSKFSNKGVDMSLRVTSIDYLGVIASRLRKDSVTAMKKMERIDELIREIKEKDIEQGLPESKNLSGDEEEERTEYLQRILLDYLAIHAQDEPALANTRHFYLAQWYKDAENDIWRSKLPESSESKTPKKKKKKAPTRGKRKKADVTSEEESEEEPEVKEIDKPENEALKTEVMRLTEIRKQFLLSKIRPFDMVPGVGARSMQTDLDFHSAELISQYLASKRPFSRCFDTYLKHIINVLSENAIAVRTKAMKCLTQVVESDPSVLSRTDMQMGVNRSFLDHSTSVREAAVDLIGKFVLSRPELLHQYYDMISRRILDTGVSVRKRVIKIMKEICMECPGFERIPEMCVKMIRRVSDEEGIRKLVMEVFQNMWFVPIKNKDILIKRVMNITDVVAACKDIGLDWFEQLLHSMFKPKEDKDDASKLVTEPPKMLLNSCKDIVKCLVDHIMKIEEESLKKKDDDDSDNSQSLPTSQRIVACMTTLYLFAKIRPQLLIPYAITLQPYLSVKCQSKGDFQIISNVARTLELVVPLIEHPSETFLAQLEEDAVKLILQHDKSVVMSCLSCLGSVINNVTKNYKLTRDCFKKYYGHLLEYKNLHKQYPENPKLGQFKAFFKRATFTVGLLLRYFDFTKEEILCGLPPTTVSEVLHILLYFMDQPDEDWNRSALQAIGFVSVRHYDVMLSEDVHLLYTDLLKDPAASTAIKKQVLQNLELYLQEEELKMIRQDQEWAKLSKDQNLKEMGDVSSGMASTVIQLYLKPLLNSFLNPHVDVRWMAMQVINLVLQQGLVHPVQIVPYLISMSTDPETSVAHGADKQLQELDKKYPGFVHMKALQGIKLSYALQSILQGDKVVRGYRTKKTGELPIAMNGFLYTLMRSTRQQRRAIAKSILKQFEEQSKNSLAQLVYFADNLAYLPYQVQDEILFIMHQIDIMISVTGSNLLQSFKESLVESRQTDWVDDDDDDMESILERLPEDITPLEECIKASQGCLLLLNLKQHLKDMFGVTDNKISQYAPADSSKVYERPITKRTSIKFDPKAVLAKLEAERENDKEWTVEEKRQLIDDYLGFKTLMLKIDSDNEDEDDDDSSYNPRPQGAQPPVPPTTGGDAAPQENHNPEKVDDQPRRIPKLCIVPPKPPKPHRTEKRSHTRSDKQKKRHKKKKRRQHSGSQESSEDEYSDPEFII